MRGDVGVAPPDTRHTAQWTTRIASLAGFFIAAITGCHYAGYLPTEPALPVYAVQQLGFLTGGTQSAANGASSTAIVGWATDAGGVTHAVTFAGGSAMRLLEPTGAVSSQAEAVNASGVVVGFATVTGGVREALVWQSSTSVPTRLPALGGAYSLAISINDQDTIVGMAQTDSGDTVLVQWQRSGGTYAAMRVDPSGGVDDDAVAINDDGQFAGTFASGAAAFFWDPSEGVDSIAPPSGSIAAEGLSSLGVEVGGLSSETSHGRAFVYTGQIGLIVMGAPPSGYTDVVADGVSDQGIIAGTATTGSGGAGQMSAVVIGTVANPTGTFVALPSIGGTLAQAAPNGMTSCGVIVGWATLSGSSARRAVAWIPNRCAVP